MNPLAAALLSGARKKAMPRGKGGKASGFMKERNKSL